MREGEGAIRRYPVIPVLVSSVLVSVGAASVFLFLPMTLAFATAGAVAILGSIAVTAVASRAARSREHELLHHIHRLEADKARAEQLVADAEKTRRQVEMATAMLVEGRDPLVVSPEMRVGAIHDLLEAARTSRESLPVVNRIAVDEEELVGAGPDRLPGTWPRSEDVASDPRARAELLRGLDELIHGIESCIAPAEAEKESAPRSTDPAGRSPTQLVDAVVQTAADGIEDLAAGLMRASELASVAERVTNRATLLALNAALEATRSGGEAFGAIAEETRQLAEFAREATDTITRLAGEIEIKVGETITAIHATSEDAKAALATAAGPSGARRPASAVHVELERLLKRATELRLGLAAGASRPEPEPPAPRKPRGAARTQGKN
jgi:methyl-accepting chemotaxis protein-like sensor